MNVNIILDKLKKSYEDNDIESIVKYTKDLQYYNTKLIRDNFYNFLYNIIFGNIQDTNDGNMNYDYIDGNINTSVNDLTDLYIRTVEDIELYRIKEKEDEIE